MRPRLGFLVEGEALTCLVANDHCTAPVAADRAYTLLSWLPTYSVEPSDDRAGEE